MTNLMLRGELSLGMHARPLSEWLPFIKLAWSFTLAEVTTKSVLVGQNEATQCTALIALPRSASRRLSRSESASPDLYAGGETGELKILPLTKIRHI
jgi:hypothetical protein